MVAQTLHVEPAAALGPAVPRTLVNRRRIVCETYQRDDGLLDVEAWLLDTRGHVMPRMEGPLPPGQAMHEMGLRVTIDLQHRIHAAHAVTLHGPSFECRDISQAYGQLVGLTIAPGWLTSVRALFAGRAGCTHLTELLGQLATTAMQATWWLRAQALAQTDSAAAREQVPGPVDSCHGWRGDGVMVQFHRQRLAQAQANEG
jgi:hypothetical protein